MSGALLDRLLTFLHHGDAPEGTSQLRLWLGETWVHQSAVILHAVGALLVAGGLIAIMVMRWWGTAELSVLRWKGRDRWVRSAVLGGWALNGVGGLMRLFEPDHPGLTMIGDVAWVQVLFIKHIALIGALWLSLLALDLGPRRWTADPPQKAFFAVVLVLLSAVLGGMSTGLVIPGVMDDEMDDPLGGLDGSGGAERYVWTNASVTLTGTPLGGDTQEVPLQVSALASEILVVVTWTNDRLAVTGRLVDPSGEVADERTRGDDPIRPTNSLELAALADQVVPGQWKVVLTTERAVQESVSVSARVTESGSGLRVLEDTITITAGNFGELNFYMDEGDWFNHTWHVEEGPAVDWDIHSHPDAATVNVHEEGNGKSGSGNFTAGPDGIYSILWIAPDNEDVTLHYRVAGVYRVHSIIVR